MKIVLCNGVFDLLHVAHIRHLEAARKMGDCLMVGLTDDEHAEKEKRKPINSQQERMEMLLALRCVSQVSLCNNSLDALEQWLPQIFCKGHDYLEKGLLASEIEFCAEHGIEIRHTPENPQTTSGIIERIKNG